MPAMNTAKHIVIGTAGHVDHGKTALVKALTGVDTDRLKEEKERGLSIELGFAPFRLPSGRVAGIVDVPGHERFVRTMLAGAPGMDVVLFVVAADEGVMPQTIEHLDILELLRTQAGIVVLTKADLVDAEWLDLIESDLRDKLRGTFLTSAPILRVSATTGAGLLELTEAIDRAAELAQARVAAGPFRMPIDRCFSVAGFGTVVTGTALSGQVAAGDVVELQPLGVETRVRNVEVHDQAVDEAGAGQRVALNLVGVDLDQVARGDVVASRGAFRPTKVLEVSILWLDHAARPLRHGDPVRLHLGTAELLPHVALLGMDEIPPGGRGFAQLRLNRPTVCARGDRFVLRTYSPMITAGGGTVLLTCPKRHRRSDPAVLADLAAIESGQPEAIVSALVRQRAPGAVRVEELVREAALSEEEVRAAVSALTDRGFLLPLAGRDLCMSREAFASASTRVADVLQAFHAAEPLKRGTPREALRAALPAALDEEAARAVLATMEQHGIVQSDRDLVGLADHAAELAPEVEALAQRIQEVTRRRGATAPTGEELQTEIGKPGPDVGEVVRYLIDRGDLVRVEEFLYHAEALGAIADSLRAAIIARGPVSVSDFRQLIAVSRKYAVPLLEHFDRVGMTRREGDLRALRKSE